MTGVVNLSSAVLPKRIELLHELVPGAGEIALLANPKNSNAEISIKDTREATRTLGLRLHVLNASSATDIEAAFASLPQRRIAGLLIAPDGFFGSQVKQLAALTLRYAIPTSAEVRLFPAAGCLMSYGGSNVVQFRQAGSYVGRILNGENPADLPVI